VTDERLQTSTRDRAELRARIATWLATKVDDPQARLEMRIMFEELLARVEWLTLAGEVSRPRSNFINGIKHVPTKVSVG
jgi:hypothetical protein